MSWMLSVDSKVGQSLSEANKELNTLMARGFTKDEASQVLSKQGVGSVHTGQLSCRMLGQYGEYVDNPRMENEHVTKHLKKALY